MQRKLRQLTILLLLLPCSLLWGQKGELSNWRSKILPADSSATLDSQTVIPHTLMIRSLKTGQIIDSANYTLRYNRLLWRIDTALIAWPLQITYRVLPRELSAAWRLFDTLQLRELVLSGKARSNLSSAVPLFDFRQMNYSGGFTRGVSLGNRQDLALNSSFNLQLAGEVGDGIQILAAISDESIPVQPEGNTRQLQELDRVFVQLRKNDTQLTAGDYELNRPGDSYFMNYFKKLQGATFSQKSKLNKNFSLDNKASIAVSRGKFGRNLIQAQEGNQGPYKLRGNNGERFIIVLSGTEKVWLNGERMQRGQDFDYLVDYNRGEITFTSRRLISRESRIVAEFEYADQSYLRSLIATTTTLCSKTWRAYLNVYQEQDSRNSTGGLNISEPERLALANAGDDPSKAIVPSTRRQEEFLPSRVFYARRDTLLLCGKRDSILEFSADPSKALYSATFSFLGPGRGNYVQMDAQAANERVYRWIAPDPITCAPQGDYEPVVQLNTPQQQRLISLGQEWKPRPNTRLHTELAISQYDRNRYSTLDQADDTGLAAYANYQQGLNFGKKNSSLKGEVQVNYEHLQRNFRILNPYRNPEFLRDWSLADFSGLGVVKAATENLLRSNLSLEKPGLGRLNYSFGTFLRESQYQGVRHEASLHSNWKGWQVTGQNSWLAATTPADQRTFTRPQLGIDKTFKRWKNWSIGYWLEGENNARRFTQNDSLDGSSFRFLSQKVYLKSPERKKIESSLEYLSRQDERPELGQFRPLVNAQEWRWNGKFQAKQAFNLQGNLNYRQLRGSSPNAPAGNTLLGRVDLNTAVWKGVARFSSTYELGSGQEPQLEFTYIRVAPGEGVYIWQDSLYNRDGVIQPNEMEVSPFPDQANYIRVATVTDQYIRTNYVNWNQSLNLDPRARWYQAKTGLKRLLKHLSVQSALRISRKTQNDGGPVSWNPLALNLSDTNLVAATASGRHAFFINRANPKWELQVGLNDNRSKLVQTTGFESRSLLEYFAQWRWNLSKALTLRANVARGIRAADSELFNNKDFRLAFQKWEPQLTWLPEQNFRAILAYRWQKDENTLPNQPASARQNDLSAELTYTQQSKWALRGKLSVVQVAFRGQANSPTGFAILNGLQPGSNLLWNLSLDRQMARNLQLRFSYEGRKTGVSPVVHVGRVQVGAVF